MSALTDIMLTDAQYGINELPVLVTYKGFVGNAAKTPRVDILGMQDAGFEQSFDFDIVCTVGTWAVMPVSNDLIYMPDDATGNPVAYRIHKTDYSPDLMVVTYGVKANV